MIGSFWQKELSDFEELGKFALTNILDGIKTDLKEFNTFHDDFFFESSLFKDSKKSEFHKTLNFLSKKILVTIKMELFGINQRILEMKKIGF